MPLDPLDIEPYDAPEPSASGRGWWSRLFWHLDGTLSEESRFYRMIQAFVAILAFAFCGWLYGEDAGASPASSPAWR